VDFSVGELFFFPMVIIDWLVFFSVFQRHACKLHFWDIGNEVMKFTFLSHISYSFKRAHPSRDALALFLFFDIACCWLLQIHKWDHLS